MLSATGADVKKCCAESQLVRGASYFILRHHLVGRKIKQHDVVRFAVRDKTPTAIRSDRQGGKPRAGSQVFDDP